MGPSPPGGQQVVEQLQRQLQDKDAELQQKMKEVQLKEAEIRRLAREQSGKNCVYSRLSGCGACIGCGM